MMLFNEEMGNVDEYAKQISICQQLELPIPFQVYKAWQPRKDLQLILTLRDVAKQNKPITVRQGYYQLKLKGLIEEGSYNHVGRLLKKMRMAGIIPMDWIVDDTRQPEKTPSWNNIPEILEAAIKQYRSDWQENQSNYVEVWLEKRTLRRIFKPITDRYDVYLCVGGGYQSLDMIRNVAERIKQRVVNGQKPIMLYFGDLNPSGKDIPRDIKTRLTLLGVNVKLEEVALTEKDVLEYNLPRNPTAKNDPRCKWFREKYPNVNYSVELDALTPQVLREKIEESIRVHLDLDKIEVHKYHDSMEKIEAREWLSEYKSHGHFW